MGEPALPENDGPEADVEEPIIDAKECARRLKVNVKTLYDAVNAGEIRGVRPLGTVLRFHWPSVLAWLAEGQGRAPRRRSR